MARPAQAKQFKQICCYYSAIIQCARGTCPWLPTRLNQQGPGIHLITLSGMYAALNHTFWVLNHTVCVLNHIFFALFYQKEDMSVTKGRVKVGIHNRKKRYVTEKQLCSLGTFITFCYFCGKFCPLL